MSDGLAPTGRLTKPVFNERLNTIPHPFDGAPSTPASDTGCPTDRVIGCGFKGR